MVLLVEYGFDEGSGTTAAEAHGGAAITSIPGWDASGKHGPALRLNGTRVSFTPFASNTNFTIMFDAYIVAAGGNNYSMFLNSTTFGTLQQAGTGGLEWYPFGAVSATSIPFTTWKHIAVTADGSTRKVFVDGVQVDSVSTTTRSGAGESYWLGGNEVGYEPNIKMDNVRVFSHALTQPEIAALVGTQVAAPESVPILLESGFALLTEAGLPLMTEGV